MMNRNRDAAPFVPGQPRPADGQDGKASLSLAAKDFVPGIAPAPAGAGPDGRGINAGAADFVPGGKPSGLVQAAAAASFLPSSGAAMPPAGMAPFQGQAVPGPGSPMVSRWMDPGLAPPPAQFQAPHPFMRPHGTGSFVPRAYLGGVPIGKAPAGPQGVPGLDVGRCVPVGADSGPRA